MTRTPRTTRSRTVRLAAIGLGATGLCVTGAGLAAVASPASSFGQAVGTAVHAAGVDWSQMPEGYTQAQYEAFWGAGFTPEDQAALGELWNLDSTETKSQAGQMLLDGVALPIEPGSTAPEGSEPTGSEEAAIVAFLDAGYTGEDVDTLAALWQTDFLETKVRAGQLVLDGQELPLGPTAATGS